MHASFTKVFQLGQPTRVSWGRRVFVDPKAQSDYKGEQNISFPCAKAWSLTCKSQAMAKERNKDRYDVFLKMSINVLFQKGCNNQRILLLLSGGKEIKNPTEAHKGCIKIHPDAYDHVAWESAQKGM